MQTNKNGHNDKSPSGTNALQLLSVHVCVTLCVLNPGTGSWMETISSLSWRSASSFRWPWWNTWVRHCSMFYSQHQEHLSVHDSLLQTGRVRLHSCCYDSLIYQMMYKTSTVGGQIPSLGSLKVFRCVSYRQQCGADWYGPSGWTSHLYNRSRFNVLETLSYCYSPVPHHLWYLQVLSLWLYLWNDSNFMKRTSSCSERSVSVVPVFVVIYLTVFFCLQDIWATPAAFHSPAWSSSCLQWVVPKRFISHWCEDLITEGKMIITDQTPRCWGAARN